MDSIVFVVTGAHAIPNADFLLLRERCIEYRIGLQKAATYKKPLYGVLSEYDPNVPDQPPFDIFCGSNLLKIPTDALTTCQTKSQKEFQSIQYLIQTLDLPEDTFVVKLSGRYIIMKDSFMNSVESVKDNPLIQGVACFTQDKQQQYTFLFALRWKWFKRFYSNPVESLGTKNLERYLVEFYEKEGLLDKLLYVNTLDIFTQISNAKQFQMF